MLRVIETDLTLIYTLSYGHPALIDNLLTAGEGPFGPACRAADFIYRVGEIILAYKYGAFVWYKVLFPMSHLQNLNNIISPISQMECGCESCMNVHQMYQ